MLLYIVVAIATHRTPITAYVYIPGNYLHADICLFIIVSETAGLQIKWVNAVLVLSRCA